MKTKLKEVETELSKQPPLVFAGEARNLKNHLAKVANGEAFLLQGGDWVQRVLQNSTPRKFVTAFVFYFKWLLRLPLQAHFPL